MKGCEAMAGPSPAAMDAWWDDVNNSTLWQDRTFHALAALYGVIAVVALVSPIPPHDFALLLLNLACDWGSDLVWNHELKWGRGFKRVDLRVETRFWAFRIVRQPSSVVCIPYVNDRI